MILTGCTPRIKASSLAWNVPCLSGILLAAKILLFPQFLPYAKAYSKVPCGNRSLNGGITFFTKDWYKGPFVPVHVTIQSKDEALKYEHNAIRLSFKDRPSAERGCSLWSPATFLQQQPSAG